jgi:hypothetical protein
MNEIQLHPLNESGDEQRSSLRVRCLRWLVDHRPGQSLVEVAIFLPILIAMLAGLVEATNLLLIQNRLTTAARSGAGYGATHFDFDDWPSTAQSIGLVTLNTVTGTLELSEPRWDVWSIRAETTDSGDRFDLFESNHVYGHNAVVSAEEWAALEPRVAGDVLAELQTNGVENAGGLSVVASLAYFRVRPILGLPIWEWLQLDRLRGLTVMRVHEPEPYTGCSLLPIVVRLNQYSIYPSNWPEGLQMDPIRYPADPVDLFPAGSGPFAFEYPPVPPVYENNKTPPALETNRFINNWPGIPLTEAQPGYLYWAREEGPAGNFGWLSWRPPASSSRLAESLTYPGDHADPVTGYPGSPADMGTTGDPPGADTGNGNGILEIGEWVENSTGNISSASSIINGYVNTDTPIQLIVTGATNGKTGENANYRVDGFLIARLVGYSFQGNPASRWILFEFVDWGQGCSVAE